VENVGADGRRSSDPTRPFLDQGFPPRISNSKETMQGFLDVMVCILIFRFSNASYRGLIFLLLLPKITPTGEDGVRET
jgi:hypothetical protein